MWGVKDLEAHVNVYIGPRAQPKEKPLLGMDVAEDKGGNLPLVVTLQTVLWNRKSVKARKDNRENGSA